MLQRSLIIAMHTNKNNTHTYSLSEETRHDTHSSHTFSESKGRADCNIFLHFKKVASVKMINEGSWWGSVHTYIRLHRSSSSMNRRRFPAPHTAAVIAQQEDRHANYMPRPWLAMWNYYQHNNNIFNAAGVQGGVWPDITSGWVGKMLCFLSRCWLVKGWLLISRRWIRLTDVCGEHLMGLQTTDVGRRGDIFKHHL